MSPTERLFLFDIHRSLRSRWCRQPWMPMLSATKSRNIGKSPICVMQPCRVQMGSPSADGTLQSELTRGSRSSSVQTVEMGLALSPPNSQPRSRPADVLLPAFRQDAAPVSSAHNAASLLPSHPSRHRVDFAPMGAHVGQVFQPDSNPLVSSPSIPKASMHGLPDRHSRSAVREMVDS